jgi:hypothetical protein
LAIALTRRHVRAQQNREFKAPQAKNKRAAPAGATQSALSTHRDLPRPQALFFEAALGGLAVDLAFRHFGQFLVGRLLLVQCLVEKRRGIVAAQLLRPSDERPIARRLVRADEGSREINEPNDSKYDDDRGDAETKDVSDIMPRYALTGLPRRHDRAPLWAVRRTHDRLLLSGA